MIPVIYPVVGLCACLLVLAAFAFRPYLRQFRQAWFVVAIILATLYGGTKSDSGHRWSFNFQNGLTDNGSYVSNSVFHAEWDYSLSVAAHKFRWCYRDTTITNAAGVITDEWHYLQDAWVTDMQAEATVQNATNMQIVCYSEYVSPVQVVTNGVYHVNGVMRSMAATNDPSRAEFVTPGISVSATTEEGPTVIMTPTNEPPQGLLGALAEEAGIHTQGE